MKYAVLIGAIFIGIFAGIIYFLEVDVSNGSFMLGGLGGTGIGMLVGSIMGYFGKKAPKEDKKIEEKTKSPEKATA